MGRKIALATLAIIFAMLPLYASDEAVLAGSDEAVLEVQSEEIAPVVEEELTGTWWYGRTITAFTYTGLQHVQARTINSLLIDYVGQVFTLEAESSINNLLYSQSWLEYIETYEMTPTENHGVSINIVLHEIPMITSIVFTGNDEVRAATLESEQTLRVGDFHSPGLLRANASLVRDYYLSRGFADATVQVYSEIDEETNSATIVFEVNEGLRYKIRNINFEGNTAFSDKELKKQMSSKERSFFRSGNFIAATMDSDIQTLALYYNNNGYVDAVINGYEVRDSVEPDEKYHMVDIFISIEEGAQWLVGNFTFEGNSIYGDDEIQSLIHLKYGAVNNYSEVIMQIQEIASLYYNNGYIQTGINPVMTRNDDTHTIDYNLVITESGQSVIEEIVITGLTKTKPYVFERELELHVGDIFSQEALQRSGQNIINTGIVSDISTGLYQGETENGVILEIAIEEGNQMQLQFGATFGGTVDGFPVSAFLSWSDLNLFGTGRDLSITTVLAPDDQEISISLFDSWVGDRRWSNGFTLSFEHITDSDALQRGSGSNYFRGYDSYYNTYPNGFDSNLDWLGGGQTASSSSERMTYSFWSFSASYTTGYTFTFRPGRLTVSAGLSIGLSRAFYDDYYDPYEWIIMMYHEDWQWSNRLSFGLTWDGRDLIQNTTMGYILSLGYTYAGGVLGGLSNYNKLTFSASGYVPLFTYVNEEEEERKLVLSATSSLGLMLPQWWNDPMSDWGWHSASMGATKSEMLYLDGMNTGRGFNTVTWLSFLWHNQIELSYPLVNNIINVEGYVSADGVSYTLSDIDGLSSLNWYFSMGFGIKLSIPGFPLGLYWAKTARMNSGSNFRWIDNSVAGGTIVLAITTSIY